MSTSSVRKALAQGAQHLVQFTLYVSFVMVPSRVLAIAPAFACEGFAYDDRTDQLTHFLRVDNRVKCEGSHPPFFIRAWATFWIVFWAILVPLCIAALLLGTSWLFQRQEVSLEAWERLHFLHGDYRHAYYWWDLVELGYKVLTMSLPLFLTNSSRLDSYVQLCLMLLLTLIYLIALILARPYKESHNSSTLGVAIASSVSLFCILLCILLLAINTEMNGLTYDSDGIATVMAICTLAVVIMLGLLLIFHRHEPGGERALRYQSSGELARPPKLAEEHKYHLFLSHSWANQDLAAVLKRQLEHALPGVCIFLDVDMQDTDLDLEQHVSKPQRLPCCSQSACSIPQREDP